ncbi:MULTISPECIES: MarR family winged helix-turn-helix transcriptional regulator [Marinomonas]|uniref:MarR family winged helix-turn-helix transcriptional regulator n=1 Tax=Marinomonas TaxID=28253 RepID=UPI00105613AE|nr:MarR family transcriptional regulator [Marinomonas flavescens]
MSTENISFLMVDIIRLMRREYQQREMSLTYMQARALLCVQRSEGMRQVALAELLEIQPITLARLIDQLSEDGLVERRQDPTDRRAYCLYLKEPALERLKIINAIKDEVRDKTLNGLNEDQIATVVEALQLMHTNLSSEL